MAGIIFDDLFVVKEIDPDGKHFDRAVDRFFSAFSFAPPSKPEIDLCGERCFGNSSGPISSIDYYQRPTAFDLD
ncbi:hypothetical protein D918_07231 [Trichuris suis]|nr:hypothetical protein D918_07231 [Trichuris suis]